MNTATTHGAERGPAACYRHFRIIDRDGRVAAVEPVPSATTPRWAQNVARTPAAWAAPSSAPLFRPPIPFVIPPTPGSAEPFLPHNHCPAIAWCGNGDLLAAWFSTGKERGLEMTILASRLRQGAESWDEAAEFFKGADRNMTGTALFRDARGTLYHFNGVGPEGVEGWENLALLLRTSNDDGVTWCAPRPISSGARYQRRHQVIAGTSVTPDGLMLQPCDGTPGGEGPSVVHVSRDGGQTWLDAGGDIRGIHAGVVGLRDGRLLAFGRAQDLAGRMPVSVSADSGSTWTSTPSDFPPIGSAQRLVLMRLQQGPLLFVSFTDACHGKPPETRRGLTFIGNDGRPFTGYGLYAAVSADDGTTWPHRRLLTPGSGTWDGKGHLGRFDATPTEAEPKGYLAATQTPDGVIHLISSGLHYRFNLAWLTQSGSPR